MTGRTGQVTQETLLPHPPDTLHQIPPSSGVRLRPWDPQDEISQSQDNTRGSVSKEVVTLQGRTWGNPLLVLPARGQGQIPQISHPSLPPPSFRDGVVFGAGDLGCQGPKTRYAKASKTLAQNLTPPTHLVASLSARPQSHSPSSRCGQRPVPSHPHLRGTQRLH